MESSIQLPNGPKPCPSPATATIPIISSYNHHILPLLDVIDKLRRLDIMKEGVTLPTIVVVGDQSHGKSSVLESLAAISLPRGQSLCTRVPLIMRMLNHSDPSPQFQLEYLNKTTKTSEDRIPFAIEEATKEIAGDGNGVSNVPLTLIVKKQGVPDLTMVDLPGIVRVPVEGQPHDICDQIQNIIMEYIKPKESIILNVIPATTDFATCGSIAMSHSADQTGERTLAVVTKSDVAPEGLHEKVSTNVVKIKLGYVCVRNRVGDESFEEARMKEEQLFKTNPLLSDIDKSMAGIPALAKKLMELQAISIVKCFPVIVKKIDETLFQHVSELKKIPPSFTTPKDAMAAFVRILGDAKDTLRKILLRGEFEEFRDEKSMHCPARLIEMLSDCYKELQSKHPNSDISSKDFLMEEIAILEELKGFQLPNFLPYSAFLEIVKKKLIEIAPIPIELVQKACDRIEEVVGHVLSHCSENYPRLNRSMKEAANTLILKLKEQLHERVNEMIEMEMLMGYTFDWRYGERCNDLMEEQSRFLQAVSDNSKPSLLALEGLGKVHVGHLRNNSAIAGPAFELRIRIVAYWDVVILRLVDNLAYHLRYYMERLVIREFEEGVMNMMDLEMNGIQEMLKEPTWTSKKRGELETKVKKLKVSKFLIAKVTAL